MKPVFEYEISERQKNVGTILEDGRLEVVKMHKVDGKWRRGKSTTINIEEIMKEQKRLREWYLIKELMPKVFWLLIPLWSNEDSKVKLNYSALKSRCTLRHNEFVMQFRIAKSLGLIDKGERVEKEKIYGLTPKGKQFVTALISLVRSMVSNLV